MQEGSKQRVEVCSVSIGSNCVPDDKKYTQESRRLLISTGKEIFRADYRKMLLEKIYTAYRRFTKYRQCSDREFKIVRSSQFAE
jgi:hypothetical protein